MGQQTRGIYQDGNLWQVDKWYGGERLRKRGFLNQTEAEGWLIEQLASRRAVVLHGQRPIKTFDQAAAHYVLTHQDKTSLETETYLLESVMPFIGDLQLHQVHDQTLAPYVSARLAAGRAHKTINLALGCVRRILNLAASTWRDDEGRTWLESSPKLTMLPLVGHQREPRPITWGEQRKLLPALPDHLVRMSLFTLNTGARDDVVCSLKWEWEVRIPELEISVFIVPRENVKGRRRPRILVCNSVAQSVIDSVRGQHDEFVFVYRRERVKNTDQAPKMAYRAIDTMNNTAWQGAREKAALGDLHVHDMRHTTGMRLREAGVHESTIADILWHSTGSMTLHYSVAQVVEVHAALEKIKAETAGWNRSLSMLQREQEATRGKLTPPKVPQIKAA